MAKKKRPMPGKAIAQNRRGRRDYSIIETFEAGIILTGTEVKALRGGRASINETFADDKNDELWLYNLHIPVYENAGKHLNHSPIRPRKLLLHRRQLSHLHGSIKRKGMTLIPLSLYFNDRGIVKIQLALGQGKRMVDKREDIKRRDWQRDKARLMRNKGIQ